jgi:hypothetical protein
VEKVSSIGGGVEVHRHAGHLLEEDIISGCMG